MNKSYLVFDASNSHIVVGIFGTGTESSRTRFALRESFQLIIPEIQLALAKAGIKKPDAIVSAIGPGSFTGIRIGVSAARNLAQLWDIPVIGINSLSFYGFQIRMTQSEPFAICIDGKQKRFYTKFVTGRGIDSIEAAETLDLTWTEIEQELTNNQIQHVYCNDPTKLTIANLEPRPVPEPEARALFDAAMALNLQERTWADLLPHYHRKNPAEQKHPEGIKRI